MSTKTSFKRIALVAVAALSLGGISAVSASANTLTGPTIAVSTLTTTPTTGLPVTGLVTLQGFAPDSAAYQLAVATWSGLPAGSTISTQPTFTAVPWNDSTYGIVGYGTTPSYLLTGHVEDCVLNIAIQCNQTGFVATTTPGAYKAYAKIGFTPDKAGTYSITFSDPDHSWVTATWSVTVTAQALNHSTVYIGATGSEVLADAASTALVGSSTAGTASARIDVRQYSTYDTTTAMTVPTAVTVAVSGAGSVDISGNSGAARGPSVTVAAPSADAAFELWSDGRTGTSTITVSVNGVVASTKTFTFVGTPTTVKSTANLKVLKAGGTVYSSTASAADATNVATTSPLSVFLTDVNGNPASIGTYVVKAASSDASVLSSVTCVAASSASSTAGELNCPVAGVSGAASGKSATVTVSLYKADGTLVGSAAAVSFTIGGAIAKEVISTDASTYVPNAPILVSVTATDSAGNPAYDQDAVLIGTPVSSILLGGTLASPTKIIGGLGTKTGAYAPATEYSAVVISGTNVLGTAIASAPFDISAGAAQVAAQAAIDAAQEATDAANAAYDAANNAMDSADAATAAAQDASDNASAALAAVTSLSATVAKLVQSVTAIATALASIKKKLGVK